MVLAKRAFFAIGVLRHFALTSQSGNGTAAGACLLDLYRVVARGLRPDNWSRDTIPAAAHLCLRTQNSRFVEKDATVECQAAAEQRAWHKSDRSNEVVARLLVYVCSHKPLPPAVIAVSINATNAHTSNEPTVRGVRGKSAAQKMS